ncbi:PilN domain-containing protein [Piscibacillus halophilus]|uniref:PilN domain-containing protein n=1 Tax=Piscibacillus halophilus TaxID=571933 RepID=UPI00158B3771|nr:PilN domain-containing protein [Piscibacillus halophilus]
MLVDINLLPKKEKKQVSHFTFSTTLIGITLLLIGLGVWGYLGQAQDLNQVNQDISQKTKMNQVLQSEVEGSKEVKQAQLIQGIAEQLTTNTSMIMTDIVEEIPRGGRLNAFKLNEHEIELNVTTETNEQAVNFYQVLEGFNLFDEVVIHTIHYNQDGDHFTTNYTIHLPYTEEEEGDES